MPPALCASLTFSLSLSLFATIDSSSTYPTHFPAQ